MQSIQQAWKCLEILIIRSEILFNPEFIVETTGTIFYIFIATDIVSTSETIGLTMSYVHTDTGTVSDAQSIAFSQGTHTESISASDQGNQPYVVDGYWNDTTDGTVADNYNIGDEQFDWVWKSTYRNCNSTDSIDTGAVSLGHLLKDLLYGTINLWHSKSFADSIQQHRLSQY